MTDKLEYNKLRNYVVWGKEHAMVNNKKKTVEELAKEMDTACALSSEISEEELIEYDAEYGYDYHEEDDWSPFLGHIIWDNFYGKK